MIIASARRRIGAAFDRSGSGEISELLAALKECARSGDLERGKELHSGAIASGLNSSVFVGSSLIAMYSKCGSLADARRVFDSMPHRNVVSWTAMMLAYAETGGDLENAWKIFHRIPQYDAVAWNAFLLGLVENGQWIQALELFVKMPCTPTARSLVLALKACSCLAADEDRRKSLKISVLEKGMMIHRQASELGCDSDVFVGNTLIDFYAKCGSLLGARSVFDRMPSHTVVSWNALLLGYAENGDPGLALEFFSKMEKTGCSPNSLTLVAALKACSCIAAREEGKPVDERVTKVVTLERCRGIHALATATGYASDTQVANTLVDTYANCGSMLDARRVFDAVLSRTVVSWNSLLLGYVENGEPEITLELFEAMQRGDCLPNSRTFVAVLKACACLAAKEEGKQVGGRLVKVESLKKGSAIHSQVSSRGCELDVFVASTMVGMYAKCGSMEDAREVFERMPLHSVVSWTALMMGCAENGEEEECLELFSRYCSQGSPPETLLIVAAMKACIGLVCKEGGVKAAAREKGFIVHQQEGGVRAAAREKGFAVHQQAVKWGCLSDNFLATMLVYFYARCGNLREARAVFEGMSAHTMASWNTLILGYVENGEEDEALEMFARMRQQEPSCSLQCLAAALMACANSAAFRIGKMIHSDACRWGLETDIVLGTSLVDFYGKCGSMAEAQVVFDNLGSRDTIAWTTLIAGYSREGDINVVFEAFRSLLEEGLEPTGVTFLCVLAACNHAGCVEEGKKCFKAMKTRFGIQPSVEHYHCMVDLLGRANQLEAAVEVLRSMPYEATPLTWKTLLGSCQKWKDAVVGRFAFEKLMSLERNDAAAITSMANIYGS